MAKYKNKMKGVTAVLKALGDESRLRVMLILMHTGELCVCQISEFLGLAPSTVSRHLSILSGAGLIESCKKGRWVHYRCAEVEEGLAAVVRGFLKDCLAGDEKAAQDRAAIKEILKEDPEKLCQRLKAK